MTDSVSDKIVKALSVIGFFTLTTIGITFLSRFFLSPEWIDNHFEYYVVPMAVLSGLVLGFLVKDALSGKIIYGILTAIFGGWLITLAVVFVMFLGIA